MWIFDGHCDVLNKMLSRPDIAFERDPALDVTHARLTAGDVLLQCFAIYLSEHMRKDMEPILKSRTLFIEKILKVSGMRLIAASKDLDDLIRDREKDRNTMGALLTLEGADGITGELSYVRTLFDLGVRVAGITWNYANWAADGALEPRGGGFTIKGKQFVKECERLGMILDVSHLSEKGFWELCEMGRRPFIATHSNAYSICPHPRNLKDAQIKAILSKGGAIGLAFVPKFTDARSDVAMSRLLRHIDHVCALGGAKSLGFGSDFDGVEQHINGLRSPADYPRLIDLLLRYYKEEEVEGFAFGNLLRFYRKQLPQ